MRFVYLPMDDRPCNVLFARQMMQAAGLEMNLLLPGHREDFTVTYDFEDNRRRLEEAVADDCCLVLSIDQLCFGGLLQSRRMKYGTTEEVLERLNFLKTLKQKHPSLRIVAFTVIMRATISTLDKKDLVYYRLMTEYSQAYHRARITGQPREQRELETVTAQIPADIIDYHHQVRARNHQVNLAAIRLHQEGIIDTLAVLQEDAQPYGIHRLEQEVLHKQIARAPEGIWLHNGADEGGCLCLMRAAAEASGCALRAGVEYLRENGGDFVARYEDRPFRQNVCGHLALAGAEQCAPEESDTLLLIHTPRGNDQRESVAQDEPEYTREELSAMAEQVACRVAQGKRVYLLDVAFANGGDGHILRAINEACGVEKLWGYSAWNTAGNSLGTMVAQMVSDHLASQKNEAFLWERLLDDYLYQSVVRFSLQQSLTADGMDIYHLTDRTAAIARLKTLYADALAACPLFARMPGRAEVTLPWARTFEAEVRWKNDKAPTNGKDDTP